MARRCASAAEPASPQYRDHAPGQDGLGDLAFEIGPAIGGRGTEPSVLPQDLVLKLLQPPARLDPELVDEPASRVLVGLQRLGLAPSGVERVHQLLHEAFPQRVDGDQRFQLDDHVPVAAELHVGGDPLLQGDEPELLEPPRLALRELLGRELGERRPAPERERLAEHDRPLLRRRQPGLAQ